MNGLSTLVFETSTPRASLAIVRSDGSVIQQEFTGDRSHNAELFKPLKALLATSGTVGIGLVLVGSGPGSYSGTRVGIAAAQGVAIAYGCPAVAVPSILAVPAAEKGMPCVAIGDARRGSFWTARINAGTADYPPTLTDIGGLGKIVGTAYLAGLPIVTFEDPARFPLPQEIREWVGQEFPTATRLWQAWESAPAPVRKRWQMELPQPIYLKPPHITPAKRPWLLKPQA